ncbi:hypothetical protein MSAN_02250100 [Mycena sanguinolenta]|uniref:histidine kinase n=1 Tax=Mycena sanguinolenta TaxID=230812 RepID=A0A8H6XB15_9AGAR|nr:hypothetical protein MSAN_02250100 [Mycena sanguinolenta]
MREFSAMSSVFPPSNARPVSAASTSTLTTLSFLQRYCEGDFPENQPTDLCFNPREGTASSSDRPDQQQPDLQSLATSVQDFFEQYGFLPAIKTLSGTLESDRAFVIHRFGLEDPSLWPVVDRCARMANILFKAPIRITLINADSQSVLASVGCGLKRRETLVYNESLCSHVALRRNGSLLDIPDTLADWRFRNMPGAPRSYAGQPLLLPVEDGGRLIPIGSICVLGDNARPPLSPEERTSFVDLADLLSMDIQRVFQETRQRKESLRRDFLSDLVGNISSFNSTISRPVDPSAGSELRKPPDPESILSSTADVRRMLDSDFACLVDLSSLHLSWKTESPRQNITRALSRSKYGWIGHGQRGSSTDAKTDPPKPGLSIIDYSCSDECGEYSPETVFNAPRAVHPLMNFLRTYTASSPTGYAYSGSDGILQYLLPPDSEAHIAIPLFSNGQPAVLLLVATKKPLRRYESADVSFASTFATLCLGSLAKVKLMKADAAKTAFVSMISHELRTPLHGLLSQLELIREFAPKEFIAETEWFLQAAEVCGLTLRDVVNDVLDFGKQEHGSGDLQAYYTEADLSVLAIEAMSVAYGRRRQWETVTGESESAVEVCVAIEESPTGWGAMIDVGGLRRVLLNLASNALKYTPKGSITLSLRELAMQTMDKSAEGQRLIEFSMKDTGIGMSSEYKSNIFTPFSQENTFNPGTGLGMSISETILARLGGEFIISSELGKGTTVTFTLPIDFLEARPVRGETDSPRIVTKTVISRDDFTLSERSTLSPRATPTLPMTPPVKPDIPIRHPSPLKVDIVSRPVPRSHSPESMSSGVTQSGAADFRVLVVEDNHIGRKVLTTLLTRKGVLFREAADGLAALTVYREFLPHLVWTDVSMPVMDGIESARRMRIIENELQIQPAHIVALTGHSSHGEMKEALLGEASLDEWLIKGQANLKTLITGLEKVQRAIRHDTSSVSLSILSTSPV